MSDPNIPLTSVSASEPAKGERTRLRIVESACGLFLDQGYHGTSMRQIAQAADLALGSIYNHFATKDEIFGAVLDAYHPWREIPAAVEAAEGATAEDLVRDAARRILATWGEHSDLVRLHSIEQVEFQGQHLPQLFESTVAQITQVAQKSSATRDIPIDLLVRAFFGLFFAYLASEQFTRAALPIDLGQNAVDFFADTYLQGLLGPSRAAEAKPGRKWH
jgi:AcrR family transcriptional regulator